jgi:hypothetical protein
MATRAGKDLMSSLLQFAKDACTLRHRHRRCLHLHPLREQQRTFSDEAGARARISILPIAEHLRSERPGSNGELERLKPLAWAPVVKESSLLLLVLVISVTNGNIWSSCLGHWRVRSYQDSRRDSSRGIC